MNIIAAIAVRIGDVARAIWRRVLEEPVFTQGMVVAAIAAGTAFGLNWNGAQVGAVTGLSAAVLAWLTRRQVTPVERPSLPEGTPVSNPDAPAGDEPPPDLVVAKVEDLAPAARP